MSKLLTELNLHELLIIRETLMKREQETEEYIVSVSRVGNIEGVLKAGEKLKELKVLLEKVIKEVKNKREEGE